MLNLPQQTLNKIKQTLLHQQKEVESELKSIEQDDPVSVDAVAEASEPGTESWQAEVHGRLLALKNDLLEFSRKIAHSLLRLKEGTYGKCEKCGKAIESERLKAMPTAALCMVCSKKTRR